VSAKPISIAPVSAERTAASESLVSAEPITAAQPPAYQPSQHGPVKAIPTAATKKTQKKAPAKKAPSGKTRLSQATPKKSSLPRSAATGRTIALSIPSRTRSDACSRKRQEEKAEKIRLAAVKARLVVIPQLVIAPRAVTPDLPSVSRGGNTTVEAHDIDNDAELAKTREHYASDGDYALGLFMDIGFGDEK
jgi:hypothetical protein